jgi:recombination protein RecA
MAAKKTVKNVISNVGESEMDETKVDAIDKFIAGTVSDLSSITGEGATQLLGSDGLAIKIKSVISTQCETLDRAIGRGGIPTGRLTIIHGAEGSGKTTTCLHLVSEVQKRGGLAIYIDKEYKLDPDYAKDIGVDTSRLVLCQPLYLEQAMAVMEAAIMKVKKHRKETKKVVPVLIVLDSMNACITKAQLEGGWEDHHMAPQARVFSSALPKIIPMISEESVALVWISQVRQNVAIKYGDPTTLSGGKAPKFYASLILEVKSKGKIEKDGNVIGNHSEVYVRKNQIAPPFKTASFDIRYGLGIDYESSLIECAIEKGLVTNKGAWYYFGDLALGQGKVNVCNALREDSSLAEKIKGALDE